MEGIAVTAATGALGPVLAKLRALLGDGNHRLEGRREKSDIEFIKSDLEAMYPIAVRLPEVEEIGAASKDWMFEARELFYDIDDAVEDFILDLDTTNQQGTNKTFPFRDLKIKLWEVSKRCPERLKRAEAISNRTKLTMDPRARFHYKDPSDLVGMDRQKATVMELLAGEEASGLQKLKVVCILGFAGMGKTTLADLVYRTIGEQFQCRAFVSLSPGSTPVDVLKAILRQVGNNSVLTAGTEATTEQYLVDCISNILADKRYLVIVDNIWHWEEWEIIARAFPDNCMCSNVMLTTRIRAIAEKCCTYEFIHELRGIHHYDAIKLSEAVILRESETRDIVAANLEELCGSIEYMSRGMPLALRCLSAAAADSLVQGNYDGWDTWIEHVHDNFLSIRLLKPLAESLWLVYDNLPGHLKTCLLYCTSYPIFLSQKVLIEVQGIDRHRLVRKWIAEGFVSEVEAAEAYIDELISRNLLLPHHRGQIFYEVHPVMLPFLVCKSKEANFITRWRDGCGSARRIRRLFINHSYPLRIPLEEYHSYPLRIPLEEYHSYPLRINLEEYSSDFRSYFYFSNLLRLVPSFSHVRSLVASIRGRSAVPSLMQYEPDCRFMEMVHLRVLDLEQITEIGNHSLLDICCLLCLRYLGLKCCSRITVIPPDIGRLQNLETLDVSSTGVTDLPTEIGELQHLEALNVSDTGIREIPSEIGKLQHLKTLNISGTRVIELPWGGSLLSNSVRILAGDKNSPQLATSRGLHAIWQDLEKGIIILSSRAKYRQDLSMLLFDHFGGSSGPLPVMGLKVASSHTNIPQWIKGHLTDVSALDIRLCRLEEDDLKFLRQMQNLQVLALRIEILPREPIVITAGGFSKLESFLVDCRLPLATFKQGAMPNLKHLEFKFYTGRPIVEPMGIINLLNIEKVVFWCSKYYTIDSPGIAATLEVVRKEAVKHPKRISLWINDKEEVFPEKGCQGNNISVAGSSGECEIKACVITDNGKGKAIQVSNMQVAAGEA